LHRAVLDRGSAVVVVAEGAGPDLVSAAGTDASGNASLADVGMFLKQAITRDFAARGTELTLKYIDPGYTIRSVPADAHDSVYCVRLAQAAVHAGMAGRTKMVVGRRHNRFIHVPISHVVAHRNQVAPDGDLWLSILESTAQPAEMR
jgi:6-phosphofructokinase 1